MCIAGLTIFLYLSPSDFVTPGFVRDGMLIQSQPILPSEALSATILVSDLEHDISIFVDKPSSDVSLKMEVKDPDGARVRDADSTESFKITFTPQILGKYTVTISSLGSKPTMISAYYGHHLPEVTDAQDGQAILDYLWIPLVIVGSYLIVHTDFKVFSKSWKNL